MLFDFIYRKENASFEICDYVHHADHLEYIMSIKNSSNIEAYRFSFKFSELQALHKQLSDLKPLNLPSFPSKTQFCGKSLEDIHKRGHLIEVYFKKLTEITERKPQLIFEQFLREKIIGLKTVKKNDTIIENIMERGKSIIYERTANSSIFSGKEYVIEGEIPRSKSEFHNYDDNVFDIKKPNRKLIKKPEKNSDNWWNNLSRFFGCYKEL